MHKKYNIAIIVIVLLCSVLSGCTDGNKLKDQVQQAYAKQTEMKNYRFQGSAQLKLTMPAAGEANPLTTAFLSALKESTLEWSGVAATEPVQLEMNLKMTPKGSATALELPLIIKDNKMYVHIPLLNQDDESFVINMDQLGAASGQQNGTTAELLKNSTQLTTTVSGIFVSALEGKWFNKTDKQISVSITNKNEQEITAALLTKIPEMLTALQTNGVISAEKAEQWKQTKLNDFKLNAPGQLTYTIDDQGFISEQKANINFSVTGQDGASMTHSIQFAQSFSEINQNPKFEKPIPEKVKPFEEITKSLGGQSK